MNHSVGEILRTVRLYTYGHDLPELKDRLELFGIQLWVYQAIEARRSTTLSFDYQEILMHFFGLQVADYRAFQRTSDLKCAVKTAVDSHRQHEAWRIRREHLVWPDSARVARRLTGDHPTDRTQQTYAAILRCLRVDMLQQTVDELAAYFDLSPLLYWQMETAQLPLSDDMVCWAGELLGVTDLTVFLQVDHLRGVLCRLLHIPTADDESAD